MERRRQIRSVVGGVLLGLPIALLLIACAWLRGVKVIEVEELESEIRAADVDRDGSLSLGELEALLQKLRDR